MAKANVILLNSVLWNLREISDLAETIKKHCGDVACTSWRYPLTSCNQLEIFKLLQNNKNLDNYTYILELTYDRLLYVFNMIIKYMESHSSMEKFRPDRNVRRPQTLSLASVICMIWDRVQNMMDTANLSLAPAGIRADDNSKPVVAAVATVDDHDDSNDTDDDNCSGAVEKVTICTQSDICSISVCSCCEMVQEFVTNLVLELEKVMENQEFESAVSVLRKTMKTSLLEMTNWSAMSNWLQAIVKDFTIVSEKTKQEAISSRKLRHRFDADEKRMKAKLDQVEDEKSVLEAKLRDVEVQLATVRDECSRAVRERNQARDEASAATAQLATTTTNFESKLRETKKSYEDKMAKRADKKKKLDEEREKEWTARLDHECRMREELEVKTRKLQSEMSKTVEEFNKAVATTSEDKNVLAQRCRDLENELRNLKEENTNLNLVLTQKQNVIDDYSKRIMEAFPQLGADKASYKASGNPEVDMETQVEANNLRIEMLKEENEKLIKTLSKIKMLKS